MKRLIKKTFKMRKLWHTCNEKTKRYLLCIFTKKCSETIKKSQEQFRNYGQT